MSAVKIAPAGDRALLLAFGEVSAAELHAAAAAVSAVPGVVGCIPGQSSLYVVFDGKPDVEAIREAKTPSPAARAATLRHIRVSFRDEYAPDLPQLLSQAGIDREAFITRIGTLRLTARYIGFRGGFAYLDGWPREWAMPRRPTSRPRVPRGTFAVAGAVAGFYPIDSPGGWTLIGRTGESLEHALAAGDEIRIDPVLDLIEVAEQLRPDTSGFSFPLELKVTPLVRVVATADWSQIGRGIPPGGAFDEAAAANANEAVGNAADAPILECALTGPE